MNAAKKTVTTVITMMLLCFLTLFVKSTPFAAAEDLPTCPAIAKADFSLLYAKPEEAAIKFKQPADVTFNKKKWNAGVEGELTCGANKWTASGHDGSAIFKITLASNKVYYYRLRPFLKHGNKTAFGEWTEKKAFCTIQVKLKKKSGMKIKVTVPKIADVSSVVVKGSRKNSSGYKKAFKCAPGKSKVISKVAGRRIKKGKTYYFKGFVTLKNKISCQTVWYSNIKR